jgi:hypothetical protein
VNNFSRFFLLASVPVYTLEGTRSMTDTESSSQLQPGAQVFVVGYDPESGYCVCEGTVHHVNLTSPTSVLVNVPNGFGSPWTRAVDQVFIRRDQAERAALQLQSHRIGRISALNE